MNQIRTIQYTRRTQQATRLLCFIFAVCLLTIPAIAVDTLVPLGITTGIRLPTDGVIVAGLTGVETPDGVVRPAQDAGLLAGDMIIKVNGEPVGTSAQVQQAVDEGKPITFTVRRGDETIDVKVTPVKGRDGYRIGIWVRDSMLGIGTLTYYDPKTGAFGALGHGISDAESGDLMSIKDSVLIPSYVTDVRAGKAGDPGELHGRFDPSQIIGHVAKNTNGGIFGTLDVNALPQVAGALPLGKQGEVRVGDAQILSCVDGDTARLYNIRILKLYPDDPNLRNILIEVTDEALLSKTGGIVQGMSGSPILQDGKLIGAVTHVLVNEPKRGYGIFIENMLASGA